MTGGQGRYRAGTWYVLLTPDAVVMVDDGLPAREVQRLWEVVHGGADLATILAELDRPAGTRVFGVAVIGPTGLQTRVRPGVALLVDRGDGGPPLVDTGDGTPDGSAGGNPDGNRDSSRDGADEGTPVAPPGLVRLIRVGATGGGADVTLPVVAGVVRADDVEWTPSRATRQARGRRAADRPAVRPPVRPTGWPAETRPVGVTPGRSRRAAPRHDPYGAYRDAADPPGDRPEDGADPADGPGPVVPWADPLDDTLLPRWTSERWRQYGPGPHRGDDDLNPERPGEQPDDESDEAGRTAAAPAPTEAVAEGVTGLMSPLRPRPASALARRRSGGTGAHATPPPGVPTLGLPAHPATPAGTGAGTGTEPPPAATVQPPGPADLLDADPVDDAGRPPTVHAVLCSAQHPNPVQATYCRSCGEALGFASVQLVTRPQLGVLRFSTGQEVVLDQNVLVGRAPRADRVAGGQLPRPVRIEGRGLDISRNHLEVRLEGWHVLVVDLGSRNGTLVTLPGRAPQLIDARVPCLIAVGTVVELTEGVTFTYEALP